MSMQRFHRCGVFGGKVAGVKGVSPLQLFLFLVFLSPEKEKRTGTDDVGKSMSEIKTRQTGDS